MNKVISKVRVTEVDGLSDALVRLYKSDEGVSSDVFLKSVMDEIEKLSVAITTAIKKDKVLSNLEEADIVRDEAVKNLSTLLDGYEVFPVAAKKEAAQKLKTVFDKYRKSIITANYVSESSLIESLLEDFSKEEEAVSLLDGIKEILEQIRSAQDAFVKASDEYNAASTVKTESASSLKKASSFCNQRQVHSVHYSNANGEQRSVWRFCGKSGRRN